jgi:transcriptional regulator with XRE-family HTH domain
MVNPLRFWIVKWTLYVPKRGMDVGEFPRVPLSRFKLGAVRYTLSFAPSDSRQTRCSGCEKHDMATTMGERVRHRRTQLGLTQDDLAQKAGISKSFLSDLENGKRNIGAETLFDLGRAMGVSLDFLMTGEASEDQTQKEIPAALATFAAEEGLSVRDMMTLLDVQERIMVARKKPKARMEQVDWKAFYQSVKKFL